MNRVFQFIFKNPLHKIVALGLTVVLYAVLHEGKQQQKEILNVPVIIECEKDIFISHGQRRAEVRITVKGSERLLKNMDVNSIQGRVNVSRRMMSYNNDYQVPSKQMVKVQLSGAHFSLPRGVEVKRIEPNVLAFPVELRGSQNIELNAISTGESLAGMVRCFDYKDLIEIKAEIRKEEEKLFAGKLKKKELKIELLVKEEELKRAKQLTQVQVTGPVSEIGQLRKIDIEPVEIKPGERDFFKDNVFLHNPDPDKYEINPKSVAVDVTIIKNKTFNIPVTWKKPDLPNMKISRIGENNAAVDNNVTVNISGSQNMLGCISAEDLVAVADLTAPEFSKNGEYQVSLQVFLRNKLMGFVKLEVIPGKIGIKIDGLKE